MQNLATLRQESPNICTSVHGPSQDIRVVALRLRLAYQTTKHAGQSDGLVHGTAGRGRSQRLQVEWQVVFDWGTVLDRLNFQSGTDVGQGRGTERQ